MLERSQGRTHPALQDLATQRSLREFKPDDIAGHSDSVAAAGDANPPAAIFLPLPRGEGVVGVVDATHEIQQRVPLLAHAAIAGIRCSGHRMPCVGDGREAEVDGDEPGEEEEEEAGS